MKHKLVLRSGILLLIGMIGLTLWGNGRLPVKADDGNQKIPWVDPALLAKSKTSEPLDFLIYFEEKADLSPADALSWEERGWFVYETLTALSASSQAKVLAYLAEQGVPYEAFWIQNVIAVQSSTAETLVGLLNYAEIEALLSIPQVFLGSQVEEEWIETEPTAVAGISANLTQIKADQAWSQGDRGAGVVLGAIDTGARFTHEALVESYRGNLGAKTFSHHYHWWDAVNGKEEPYDDHGHGSHVVGIMAGGVGSGDAIGVAPGASWIACKAISASGFAWGNDLIKCGQFMAAPTNLSGENPNPNLRPQAVNNSWGDCGRAYNAWYQGVIDAWVAMGIYPVFANGNNSNCGYSSPPGLNTVGNPARSHNVTSVGSTGRSDGQYAPHSNWGPTDDAKVFHSQGYPTIKPEVVAPGVDILSAAGSDDRAYAALSGTSMSAPHVTGQVALMWGSAKCLLGDVAATTDLILETARPIPYDTGQGDEGPDFVPNHATGWGEIDAQAAVNAARAYCAGGHLDGYVLDHENQQPITGALVAATSQGEMTSSVSALTDKDGYYRIHVNSATPYTLTASAYGYHPVAVGDVLVDASGGTTTTHFHLMPKSNLLTFTGTVTDGSGHGYPLYARITLENENYSQAVYTNPFDGRFQVTVYDDLAYDLNISAMVPGYQPVLAQGIVLGDQPESLHYTIEITAGCEAPGYASSNLLAEGFDSRKLPPGWEVWDHAGTGVTWGFEDQSERSNQTGGSGGFAMVDSDYHGSLDVDVSLVTPPLDFLDESTVMLSFSQNFFSYQGNRDEIADVDVYVGGEWYNVLRQTENQTGQSHPLLDISELAAHQPYVRVRFHYYNASAEWWWQIDNVQIGSHECALVPGGLLAGFITDSRTGEPLVGAVVSNSQARGVSSTTPVDPGLPDGFYWMFQPMLENPQVIAVKTAKSLYLSELADVELRQDEITRHDVTLVSYWNYLEQVFNKLLSMILEFVDGARG
ncbi:MAG TPA: S8 family serine peptidase [Brevefilum fermentans]|nr:S8 family serine peptidase [Brevefilum fermentans]MDI9565525.1 S8 family serine peptidase [Chloroflexota bacterium]OQB87290.1 MAG: Bacillopeptidase F precursor [Chloroflexi bacterium ADurb.Bin120]HOM67056.1 S8 family serine peptidase [Brevefilum fermentans]HPX95678.1 S8 family serine peptidase [Brevefilum fermentans]HQA28237.1 S8 family serine peptidase [Brevefilum fermentans]